MFSTIAVIMLLLNSVENKLAIDKQLSSAAANFFFIYLKTADMFQKEHTAEESNGPNIVKGRIFPLIRFLERFLSEL